eukprot:m.166819 g.166819  ORF g.166819 m.166819 type:complete len:492 (-) comp14448_c2_seq1:643-2118(-)
MDRDELDLVQGEDDVGVVKGGIDSRKDGAVRDELVGPDDVDVVNGEGAAADGDDADSLEPLSPTPVAVVSAPTSVGSEVHMSTEDCRTVASMNKEIFRTVGRAFAVSVRLEGDTLRFRGNPDDCAAAVACFTVLKRQREGKVDTVDDVPESVSLTQVAVPSAALSAVSGTNQSTLRQMEQAWRVVAFFTEDGSDDAHHQLVIFGSVRARCSCELQVLSFIEEQQRGFFLEPNGQPKALLNWYNEADPLFDVSCRVLEPNQVRYALGAKGQTKRKLKNAADCVLEFIGNTVFVAGTQTQRERGILYLDWLIQQQRGAVEVNPSDYPDILTMSIPRSFIGFVAGAKGKSLRAIEMDTATFCFLIGNVHRGHTRSEQGGAATMCICAATLEAREAAKVAIERAMDEKRRLDRDGSQRRRGRRSRSPPPRRLVDRRAEESSARNGSSVRNGSSARDGRRERGRDRDGWRDDRRSDDRDRRWQVDSSPRRSQDGPR